MDPTPHPPPSPHNVPYDPSNSSEERRLGTMCPLLGIWSFFFPGFVKLAICILVCSAYQHFLSGQDIGIWPSRTELLYLFPHGQCSNFPPILQVSPTSHSSCSSTTSSHTTPSIFIFLSERECYLNVISREWVFTMTPSQQLANSTWSPAVPPESESTGRETEVNLNPSRQQRI